MKIFLHIFPVVYNFIPRNIKRLCYETFLQLIVLLIFIGISAIAITIGGGKGFVTEKEHCRYLGGYKVRAVAKF